MTPAPPRTGGDLTSIVLPIRNQASHLETIVRDFESALGRLGLDYEILLVVNASQDNSLALAHALAQTSASVRVIASERAGWGHAVRLGLAAARGTFVCYTNSARTSAEDLSLVLLYARAYPGVVIKVNRRVRDYLYRRVGSLLFNLQCRMLFELSCWDVNGTPKVFPRECSGLFELTRSDDLLDLEFNVVCQRRGYRMLEVPILSYRRHGGRSTTNWSSALKLYWGAYRMWRARPPVTS